MSIPEDPLSAKVPPSCPDNIPGPPQGVLRESHFRLENLRSYQLRVAPFSILSDETATGLTLIGVKSVERHGNATEQHTRKQHAARRHGQNSTASKQHATT